MPTNQRVKTEIDEILDRMQHASEKKIRSTKSTTYKPETETYVHRIRKAPGGGREIVTVWGDGILDKGFTLVPNVLLDHYVELGLADRHMVLIEVLLRFGHGRRQVYPSQKTLAGKTGNTVRRVQKIIRELREMGYLQVYKRYLKPENSNPRKTSNMYDLTNLLEKLRDVVREEKEKAI